MKGLEVRQQVRTVSRSEIRLESDWWISVSASLIHLWWSPLAKVDELQAQQ